MVQQLASNVYLSATAGEMWRCIVVVVFGMYIGALAQEKLNHIIITICARLMEWRIANMALLSSSNLASWAKSKWAVLARSGVKERPTQ